MLDDKYRPRQFEELVEDPIPVAIELYENLAAVTAWRATLPERERRRLIGAQANVKRWRKETRHGNGKCPQDLKREAKAAWKRFVWCVRSLPPHEAAPLCQTALAEVLLI
jgi:hypothetical protein